MSETPLNAEKVELTEAEVERHVCCVKPRLCVDEHFHQKDVERIVATRIAASRSDAANDPDLRLSGHSGISITRLKARAQAVRDA